jgi:hypothetical protein
VVPATLLVKAMDGAVAEQIVCKAGVAVATGNGLTVIVTAFIVPAHPFAVGTTV